MSPVPKRGALIGCGFFAQNHLNGWRDVPGAEIVAVCDTDRAKAEAAAKTFGIAGVYTDADTMLAEVSPDFVDIATTPPSHRALVELVCAHKTPVICQKPIADTYADARAMVAAAEAAGVPFAIHENFRWQNGFLRMKDALDAGRIGTPHTGRFSFRHAYDVYANQPYLAEFERFALMDVGIHLYDVVRHFLGDVRSVACEIQTLKAGIAGEDAFTSLLRHTSGAVTVADCSFYSKRTPDPFPETMAVIEGSDGTLELTTGFHLHIHDAQGRHTENSEPPVPAWGAKPWHSVQDSVIRFQAHWVDVLNGRAAPQPSGAHNLGTLALALASYDAAEAGSVIDMAAWEARQ